MEPHRVDVRRGADRPVTTGPGTTSRHALSHGHHYDPANTSYGVLLACNEDVVEPGAGYGLHRHRDLEIVTWVLEGTLVHRDATGRAARVRPGTVQWLGAGSGVEHAETNDGDDGPVRLLQMWVAPDEPGLEPGYARADLTGALADGALVPAASGVAGTAPVRLRCAGVTLHVGRPGPGGVVVLPEAAYVHVAVAGGEVELEGVGTLAAGDALRSAGGGQRITAVTAAEVVVWEMHRGLGGPGVRGRSATSGSAAPWRSGSSSHRGA